MMFNDISRILVFSVGAAYFLYAAALRLFRKELSGKIYSGKKVSLIVPAKNEAQDLPRLLNSLANLNYLEENLEIILIDHRSTDGTGRLMREFKDKSPFRVKIITMSGPDSPESCKAEALRKGIEAAAGELLVFTDAEAAFNPDWLQAMTREIWHYDLIGGPVIIEGSDFFPRMLRLDWLFLSAAGAGLTGMNQAQTVFGKNLAVTRKLYDKSGGFSPGYVLTEDLDLVQKCRGKGIIGCTLKKECAIYSIPPQNAVEFFRQRVRWIKGAMVQIGFAGWTALIMSSIINIAVVYSAFAGTKYFLTLMAIKCLSDSLVLNDLLCKLGQPGDRWLLPFYSIFAVIYQTILAALLPIARNIKWR